MRTDSHGMYACVWTCQGSGSRRLEAALLPHLITCEHPPRGKSAPACGCCRPWCRERKGNKLERHWLALCHLEADLFLLQNFYMAKLLNCTMSFFINPMKMHSDSTFYVSKESAFTGLPVACSGETNYTLKRNLPSKLCVSFLHSHDCV